MTGKDVKKNDAGAVAVVSDADALMADYIGAGLENTDMDDFALPYLSIVQKTSEIIDTNPEARPGMLYNTVTGDLYTEIEVIPCSYKKEWVEWVPHNKGGGLVGIHDYDSGKDKEADWDTEGKFVLPNGNLLNDTRYHYVLAIDPNTGETFPVVMTMSSSQMKKSKKWMAVISNRKIKVGEVMKPAPMFAFSYKISTVAESNDKGKWFGFSVAISERVSALSLVQEAINLYKGVASGESKEGNLENAESPAIDGESEVM